MSYERVTSDLERCLLSTVQEAMSSTLSCFLTSVTCFLSFIQVRRKGIGGASNRSVLTKAVIVNLIP